MSDAENRERSRRPADEELTAVVHTAQRGDADAFRVVYRTVQPGLLRYLRVLVGGDAEDVASETWLQVVRDLSSFRGDADGFRGWVATIGRHRAMDHLRRIQRRPSTAPVDQLAELPADHDTAASALESVSTDTALALIATLPRDQAEAVLLRVVMGLDAKTAARVLGKRAGAVRTAAHRGLRRLAESLPPPADRPPDQPATGPTDRPRASSPKRSDGDRVGQRRVADPAPGDVTQSAPSALRRLR